MIGMQCGMRVCFPRLVAQAGSFAVRSRVCMWVNQVRSRILGASVSNAQAALMPKRVFSRGVGNKTMNIVLSGNMQTKFGNALCSGLPFAWGWVLPGPWSLRLICCSAVGVAGRWCLCDCHNFVGAGASSESPRWEPESASGASFGTAPAGWRPVARRARFSAARGLAARSGPAQLRRGTVTTLSRWRAPGHWHASVHAHGPLSSRQLELRVASPTPSLRVLSRITVSAGAYDAG